MKAWTMACLGAAGLAASGLAILPRGLDGARLLTGPGDDAAAAEYILAGKSAADYQSVAEHALAAKDEDLAASLAALAEKTRVPLPPDLIARISTAQADASARIGEDAINGFLSGDASNGPALAGAVTADLTGVGDIRDLYQQATNYLTGAEVDGLTVGLATIGLGLTAATAVSLGLTLPERAGLSIVKAVKRAGRLSPALVREVGVAATAAMDTTALKGVATSLARLDLAAAQREAALVMKPAALQTLKTLGTDAAAINRNAGYRATLETLGAANSAEEVGRVARLSTRFGTATRAVLALGGAAFTLASLMASAAFWSLSLLFWCCAAVVWLGNLGVRITRWMLPKPQRRLQPA